MNADYRFICARCDCRYGVPHHRGWVDITVCDSCATKEQTKRYGDGKISTTKYYQPRRKAVVDELPVLSSGTS